MIPRDFCNWLKGYLDAHDDKLDPGAVETLRAQLKGVRMDYYHSPYGTGVWTGGTVLTNGDLTHVAGTTATYGT